MRHIESLENRRLLSASVHAAAKSKPTIPNVVGTYTGTGNETKPIHAVGHLQLNVTTESAKGAISGTFTNLSENKTGTFTGKVTAKDAFKIKVIDTITHKTTFNFSGKYVSTNGQIAGTYKGAGTKTVKPSKGTFSLIEAID